MNWYRKDDGNYVCVETGQSLAAVGSGSNWIIRSGANTLDTSPFATEADAQTAIRKLINGQDPADQA